MKLCGYFNKNQCVQRKKLSNVQKLRPTCFQHLVPSTSINHAILGFKSAWLSQFLISDAVQADSAFAGSNLKSFFDARNVSFPPAPPQRHSWNPLESKHSVIRTIFLNLRAGEPHESAEMHALCAASISNNLYGNDVM